MIYREDDWKAEVEVLENNSDAGWMRFKLKVIKTLRPSAIYEPTKDGTIFCVEQMAGVCFGGMWTLEET